MATTFSELLGEQLLQHNESDNGSHQISTNQLNGKIVVLYFGPSYHKESRNFTSKLAEIFKEMNNEVKDKLEIVYIWSEEPEEKFDEYFKEMPWKALPFSDQDRTRTLYDKYDMYGVPRLLVLSSSCEKITSDGANEFIAASKEAIRRWSEGKCLFWSREPCQGEHAWEGAFCYQCYISPLIGTRYGCIIKECKVNVCETCLPKYKHEHPLVEYLTPKQHYSLEQLFRSVPHLLNPNNEEKIEIKTMWEEGVKSIGFYFSAHWCQPCREFTPKLAELYKEAQASSDGFRIVFVSSDDNEETFNEYRSTMPWPAVPLDSDTLLRAYFQNTCIPSLYIVSSDEKFLSHRGTADVLRKGIEALKTWAQGEKLAPPSTDEFLWTEAECKGCNMDPLIGQRYRCLTCDWYDLCSACEKKGHEHPLELVPQPTDD